jgi:hypothetical protein
MRALSLCAVALLIPCSVAEAAPDALPRGDYRLEVTSRWDGDEAVKRFKLSARAGVEPGTTRLTVTPLGGGEAEGLPLPGAPVPAMPSATVVLDADGEPLHGDRALADGLRLALRVKGDSDQRVALPDGGWMRMKTTVKPAQKKALRGELVDEVRVEQRLRGEMAGQAFSGGVRSRIRTRGDVLISLRGVQRLDFDGALLVTVVELRPASTGDDARDEEVGFTLPASQVGAAFGFALFGLVGLGGLRIGKQRTLCLTLCLMMVVLNVPFAQQAHAGWPFGVDKVAKKVAKKVVDKVAPAVTAVAFGLVGGVAGGLVGGPVGVAAGATAGGFTGWHVWHRYFAKREVTGKRHEEANRYVTSVDGDDRAVVDDEDWILELRDGDRTIERYVSEEVYKATELGESFRLGGGEREDAFEVRAATSEERQARRDAGEPVTLPGAGSGGAIDAIDGLSD